MNYFEFCKKFPIRQSFHTGLYGWERRLNCINLARCNFRSIQAAGKNRKTTFLSLEESSEKRGNL